MAVIGPATVGCHLVQELLVRPMPQQLLSSARRGLHTWFTLLRFVLCELPEFEVQVVTYRETVVVACSF